MGYQFQKSPTFSSGSEVTATDIVKLADGFNDRIKSGIGDCSRRILQSISNTMRNMRNPQDEFTFPSQLEALTYYNHVSPDAGELWPTAPRGEPEGANLANPVNAFVFGNPQNYGEPDRLTTLVPFGESTLNTADKWLLAKDQRGGYDSSSALVYQPFNSASQAHFQFGAYSFQFYLKSPGGYLPTPVSVGTCTDSLTDPTIVFPSKQIKFTRLSDSFVVTYSGTCGPDFGGTTSDVANVYDFPFAWYVLQFDSTVTQYLKSLWIQGPYTGGGELQKDDMDFLNRAMLNSFDKEFKGAATFAIENIEPTTSPYPTEKFGCSEIMSHSFDFEDVINRPWQLSPAFAVASGDDLLIHYPSSSLKTNHTASRAMSFKFPNSYSMHPGFVCGGYYCSANNLSQSVTVQILANNTQLLTEFTLPTGSVSNPLFADTCHTFNRQVTGSISFVIVSDLKFKVGEPGPELYVEISELWEAYPQVYDIYTYLRISSTTAETGIDTGFTDTFGYQSADAKLIWEEYDRTGAACNINNIISMVQPEQTINTNPPYNALRQFVRSISRFVKKEQITAYAVENGKSILWFNRYIDGNTELPMWDGILHPTDSGSNGIRLNVSGAWTNEWVMDIGMKPTNPSISSIWKDNAYNWGSINRALFLNSVIPNNYPDIYNFVTDGGNALTPPGDLILVAPEAGITYLNYDRNVNTIGGELPQPQLDFYKSCPIYKEPDEIESITADVTEVKITFKGRLQHCDNAPASIARSDNVSSLWYSNILSWASETETWADPETYRTDENAIRDYLRAGKDLDNNTIPFRTGDCAARNQRDLFTDQPNGFISETFMFTKLMPKPATNTSASAACVCDDQNKTTLSSEFVIQAEYYLRSICEGFVDGTTPFVCDTFNDPTSTAFDYTYPNLCYEAFSGSHITYPRRLDNGTAYGVLPTFQCYAKPLQQIGSALNLLTKARLPLPFLLETRTSTYHGVGTFGASILVNGDGCADSFVGAIINSAGPPADILDSVGDWTELVPDIGGNLSFGGSTTTGFNNEGLCDGNGFILTTARTKTEFRFQLVDPNSISAISAKLYDNVINGTTNGFFANVNNVSTTFTSYTVGSAPDSLQLCGCAGGDSNIFWDGSTGYNRNQIDTDTNTCVLLNGGVIDMGTNPPSTAIFICRNLGCDPDAFSGDGGEISQRADVKNTNTLVISIPLKT